MPHELPRYAPDQDLPPYAFLPGRDPHPTRDPRGHSYASTAEPEVPYIAAADWSENEAYLFGVDLYNHGFLWEAHEAWEGTWIVTKADEVQAEHLQGLIQFTDGNGMPAECKAAIPAPVPTVSEWGMVLIAMLVLTGGTIVLRRSRRSVATA